MTDTQLEEFLTAWRARGWRIELDGQMWSAAGPHGGPRLWHADWATLRDKLEAMDQRRQNMKETP